VRSRRSRRRAIQIDIIFTYAVTCSAADILPFAVVVGGSLLVTTSSSLYGNDVIPRNKTETTGLLRTWIDPDNRLIRGILSRYFLYANPASDYGPVDQYSPTTTRIQIWRPTDSDFYYTLVWERRVQLNTTFRGAMYTVLQFAGVHALLCLLCRIITIIIIVIIRT